MTTPTAQAAADAARATRARAITEAWNAYLHDVTEAWNAYLVDSAAARKEMPNHPDEITAKAISNCRLALTACDFHLNALTRLIAQRDGMPVSDGPDTGERRYG